MDENLVLEYRRLVRAAALRGLSCKITKANLEDERAPLGGGGSRYSPFIECPGHSEMAIRVSFDDYGKFDIWYHETETSFSTEREKIAFEYVSASSFIFGLSVDAAAELMALTSARDKPMTKEEIKALVKYIGPEIEIYSGSREPNETDEEHNNRLITSILADKSY